jgi:hypothetical protein
MLEEIPLGALYNELFTVNSLFCCHLKEPAPVALYTEKTLLLKKYVPNFNCRMVSYKS